MTTGGRGGAGWPARFEVSLHRDGATTTYRVVTWSGPGKARSLAREAHRRSHPQDEGPFTIEVVEVAPPSRTARGTVALESDDVIDRLEF